MQRKRNGSSQQALPPPAAPDRTPPTAIRLHEDEDMSDGEAEAIRALRAEYAAKRTAQKPAPSSTPGSFGRLSNIILLMTCSRYCCTTKVCCTWSLAGYLGCRDTERKPWERGQPFEKCAYSPKSTPQNQTNQDRYGWLP